jgi:exopolysaccharide biosynthesis polyprenyl glycosylphosphotransferase
MSARTQKVILLATDFVTICLAWLVYYIIRVRSGWIQVPIEPELLGPIVAVYLFWFLLFVTVGLYRPWYAASRFDELALLFKTLSVGCLFLFFAVFVDDAGASQGPNARIVIAVYWGILLTFVSTGRLAVRSMQRRMLIGGIGTHTTIIVGSAARTRELYDEVLKYPALGYRVKGVVGISRRKASMVDGVPFLGSIEDLPMVIDRHGVRDVLVALDSSDHDRLLDVIAKCSDKNVGLKIMPDLYDIISGQARTNQIYGFPLIEISPQLMPPWEEAVKRFLDVAVSGTVLLIGSPLWLMIGLMVKLESRGPVLYRQERVGREGKYFKIVKFRSMYQDAERTGPQWAGKRDPRVTKAGKILRQLHLDEFPQMWNVLKGEMSLVGPRPERPMFVEQLSREIPLYVRRLKVRPGVTGWAQVKHKYDENIEDVRKKVQYDLYYIENMSLRMDFKIILNTLSHMLLGKGH